MNTAKSTTSRTDNNENDIKGHLVTKSSALCTDSCKLEKQFMIAQNLASHYKRIINAKSSIDSKPPKSMVKSQKARDRLRRDSLNQSKTKKSVIARPRSADGHKYKENLVDSEALNKFRSSTARSSTDKPLSSSENLHQSMFDSMRNATFNRYNVSLLNSKTNINDHNANTSMHLMTQQTDLRLTNILNELANPSLKAMSRLVSGKNYDVLDNHSHKFKQPQTLFEPRIKIRKGESKLKQTGVYYPPRPRPKSSARDSARDSVKESARSEKSNTFEDDYEPMTTSRSNINTFTEQRNETKVIPSPRISPRKKEITIKRSAEKEEELIYLNFIKEVTDDIIARGVCTNRAINNVFEYHIKRQKDKLNEMKMRELLATLRLDIGIPSQDEPNTDVQYSQTILKATNYDDEKHRQKMQNLDSHNEKYLVLDKFGWTAEYESPRKELYEKSDFEMRRKQSTIEANKKNQASKSNEFERSQSDLMKNIDSIRKTNRSASITSSKFDSSSQAKIRTDETDNLSPKLNRKENKSHFAKPDFENIGTKKPERKFSFGSTKDEESKRSPPSSPDEIIKSKSTFDSKPRKQSDSSDIFNNNFDNSFTKKNERSNSAHSQASNKSPLKTFEFKEDRDTKPARKFSFDSDDSDSTIKKSSNQDLRKSPISSPIDFKESNNHEKKVSSRKQSDASDIFNNKFDNSMSKKNERSESIHSQASSKSPIKTFEFKEDKETKPARKFSFGSDDSDSFNQKPSSNQGLKKSPISSVTDFKESNNHEKKVPSRKQSDASDIFNNKFDSSMSKKNERSDSIHSQTSNKSSLMKTFEFKENKETKPARKFSFGSDDDEKSEKQMNFNGRKSPSNELKVNSNKENSRKLSDSSEPFDTKPDNSINKNKERSNSIHSEASTKVTSKTFETNNNNNKNSNLSQIKTQTRHSSSSDENELQKTYKTTLKRNNSNSSDESGIVNNFNSTIKKNNNESKRSTPDPFEQDFGATEESDNESDNLLKTKSQSKLLATMKPHQTIQNFDQWNSDTENELKKKSPIRGKVTFSSNKSGDSDDSF